MNNTHKLEVIKALIKCYFDENLQNDETPLAAKKRNEIKQQLLELSISEL